MVRVEEYYPTEAVAKLALDWYYRNYPGSVMSIFEASTEGKNLDTELDKVWCLYGTQYGND